MTTEQTNLGVTNLSEAAAAPLSGSGLRRGATLFRWLVQISRFGLAGLFLFTAGAKLAILQEFAANMAELLSASGLNFRTWMWPATITVIVVEIIAAIMLLLPKTVRLGAILVGLMLLGFSAFAVYYVYVLQGEPLECGCFGKIIGSQLGVKTALRNLGLLIPVLLVIFGYRRTRRTVA
jgi:hypothetical protein